MQVRHHFQSRLQRCEIFGWLSDGRAIVSASEKGRPRTLRYGMLDLGVDKPFFHQT